MNIGSIVEIISNASYKHYADAGIVVGFTKNNTQAYVKFKYEEKPVRFRLESLKEIHCDHLFYMVDVDLVNDGIGVIETVECDLFRSQSLHAAKAFARTYAKDKKNFDFEYLHKKDGDYYEVTIRKCYKEETETENGEWDDWISITVRDSK